MNEILFFASIALCFFGVVLCAKFFKRDGLYVWIAIATVLANICVSKQIKLFGLDVTLGNVMFASIFLATDIMNELYGYEESKKAVNAGLMSALLYVAVTQYILRFVPSDFDTVSPSMNVLFAFTARTMLASVFMFFIANKVDVWMYQKIKDRIPNHMWLRNNVSTIVCNCAENFFFTFLALYGVFGFSDCIMISISTSIVEAIVGICDTPFLYLAKRICKGVDYHCTTTQKH